MNYYNYFTEIEEHFVRRRGKHLYVSPLDWSLIATWRDAGVPLNVALRGIDIAMDGFFARKDARKQSKVNTLFFCHDTVMSEHARYLEVHVGQSLEAGGNPDGVSDPAEKDESQPDKPDVMNLLGKRIREIEMLHEKHSSGEAVRKAAERAMERLKEINAALEQVKRIPCDSLERDLAIVDESLVEDLGAALDPDQMAAWSKEARKELKIYRKRLPKETYDKILHNYMRGKIHNFYKVGELSLFQL